LIVVMTAALRPAIVVFVTAHSTPARLQQRRISRFLRELSQEESCPAVDPGDAGHRRGDPEWAAVGEAATRYPLRRFPIGWREQRAEMGRSAPSSNKTFANVVME
jgi:hypothetical protein